MTKKPSALIILDGFGYSYKKSDNAIWNADMPFLYSALRDYPHALLQAAGTAVGLPEGVMGNSRAGHMTIGCGRIIKQPITEINEAIADGSFFQNSILRKRLEQLSKTNGRLHLLGLLSTAGVHGSLEHLYAFLKLTKQYQIQVILDLFLDGRDMPPRSASGLLSDLEKFLNNNTIIGSLQGRWYAMDRNNNWQRTEQSYNALTEKNFTNPLSIKSCNWRAVLDYFYEQNIYDEFIPPVRLWPTSYIKNKDALLFFNIREDRSRQLIEAFIEPKFKEFKRVDLDIAWCLTLVTESPGFPVEALYPDPYIKNTFLDVLDKFNLKVSIIAESEKYTPITYFFNGCKSFYGKREKETIIPSYTSKNLTNHPQMRAPEITKAAICQLEENIFNFYIINYANADMIGHSGNIKLTEKALETLDIELEKLYQEIVIKKGGSLYITADHGKAEHMFDVLSQQPSTGHTSNPVYFIALAPDLYNSSKKLSLRSLADIAPYILKRLNLPIPNEMQN